MNIKTLWHSKSKKEDKKSSNLLQIDAFKYKTAIEIRFADLDALGHVNNAIYFTFLEIARTKYWQQAIDWDWEKTGVIIAHASIDYIRPIFLKDNVSIYVRTARAGNTSFDLEYLMVKHSTQGEQICASGKTVCVSYDYGQKQPTEIPVREKQKIIDFEQL